MMFNRDKNNSLFLKYISWFIVSFFVYFQFLIQTSSSLLQNAWADYFYLTPLSVSLLSASFFYTYLFFQIPIGVIYDRFNERTVLALSSFGLGMGCILFAMASNYYFAIFARMLMGSCAAFGFIGMLKVTANQFPGKQFSLMVGLSESFGSIVMMFGVILLAWAIMHFTWQQLMMCLAASVFAITVAVILFIQPKPQHAHKALEAPSLTRNIFLAMTNRTVLITGLYGFFMASVVNSFTSLWGVAFLTEAYSITSALAAKIMSTVFLGLAVGCPINGYFSKRFGHEREAMMFCAFACAVCMALVIYVKMSVLALYFLFFIIGLLCAVYVQAFAIIGQAVPVTIQATSMAVANMLIMSSAPVLQILIGAVLNAKAFGYAHNAHQNFQIALGILPLGMLLAFFLCFLIGAISQDDLNATNVRETIS